MLSARDICKSYRSQGVETPVLRNVSLDIEPGGFVAIVGRSGSGKSTLLSVLSTLLRPDSGALTWRGRAIGRASERVINDLRRKDFSVVFQQHQLMPYLTAQENVLLPFMHGLRPVKREQIDKARECLARVGLADKGGRLPGQLSGGEQQRVAIARALATSPALLFADEPTGSLDKATGQGIMELLAGLNSDGPAVVLVTHEPAYAKLARTVAVMEDGRLTIQA
ncbi:MAG: ABC transporter ATP-binding protein [Desulfocurvibacter africanus]